MDYPTTDWGGLEPPAGDAGFWHCWAWPECMVQCSGVGRGRDDSLQFCINFCCLNTCMKKDSCPLPRMQGASESLVGAGHFSCLDLKSGFWQIKMEETLRQYTAFTLDGLGLFECSCMPFGL